MADPTSILTSAPDAPPNPRVSGENNQAWFDERTNGKAISTAAKKDAYCAILAEAGIDATKPSALDAGILAARQGGSRAVHGAAGSSKATNDYWSHDNSANARSRAEFQLAPTM